MDCIDKQISGQSLVLAAELRAESENMMEFIRIQSLENRSALFQDIRNALHVQSLATMSNEPRLQSHSSEVDESVFELNTKTKTMRLGCTTRRPKVVRCKCQRGRSSVLRRFCPFGFRIDNQKCQECSVHGKLSSWSFSIEAKLSPWLNGALEFTLGVLSGRQGWSLLSSLKFHATVKRSKSPIFTLFDKLIRTCSTPRLSHRSPYGYVVPNVKVISLKWNTYDTRRNLRQLVQGIEKAISFGEASGSDMDENGCTLLTVSKFNICWSRQ
jgi:hypothetical protein